MSENDEELPLSNPSVSRQLDGTAKVAAYFRDLEGPLLHHIDEADAVVGCVAWLTNLKVLKALAAKRAASVLVQKEDFLRPDRGPLPNGWKVTLQRHYDAIRPIDAPIHLGAGWLEVRTHNDRPGYGSPLPMVGLRCVGHLKRKKNEAAMPRMHHKFLVFLRRLPDSDREVIEGAWPYLPYAAWTGSYNITQNGNASLENAIYIEDERVATAYCDEWAQLVGVSESLDWTSTYAAPEVDFNSGAIYS